MQLLHVTRSETKCTGSDREVGPRKPVSTTWPLAQAGGAGAAALVTLCDGSAAAPGRRVRMVGTAGDAGTTLTPLGSPRAPPPHSPASAAACKSHFKPSGQAPARGDAALPCPADRAAQRVKQAPAHWTLRPGGHQTSGERRHGRAQEQYQGLGGSGQWRASSGTRGPGRGRWARIPNGIPQARERAACATGPPAVTRPRPPPPPPLLLGRGDRGACRPTRQAGSESGRQGF